MGINEFILEPSPDVEDTGADESKTLFADACHCSCTNQPGAVRGSLKSLEEGADIWPEVLASHKGKSLVLEEILFCHDLRSSLLNVFHHLSPSGDIFFGGGDKRSGDRDGDEGFFGRNGRS